MTIRVLIADDHTMVRNSLAMFLASYPDLELVGQAADGAAAVALCLEARPDVVLMDIQMPEVNGIEATRRILDTLPNTRIIALTSFKDDDLVQQMIGAGAVGYLVKADTTDELVEAIRDAYAGKIAITPEIFQKIVKSKPAESGFRLTDRESEILTFIVHGLTNRQIAEKLSLSPATIKFHVSSILAKLNAVSRAEAAAIAIEHNLTKK